MNDSLNADTIDYIAIRRLQDAYADIVTRRAWSELHEIFVADIEVSVDRRAGSPLTFNGPDQIGQFIAGQIDHMDFFEFVILNTRVFQNVGGDSDHAIARMYINELRHEHGRFTHAYGLYRDDYRRIGNRWWFTRRRYQSLARTGPEFLAFDLAPTEF